MDSRQLKTATDHELMALIVQGETLAFEELIQRYQKSIVHFLFQFVRDANRAADLSQETFLRVFQNASRYTPKASFATWIYTIAANLAKDELKTKKSRKFMSLSSVSNEEEDGTVLDYVQETQAPPPEILEAREREKVVWSILDTLSEPYRSTLILRDFQDLSYEEIASIQKCSLGTVKSRVNRARLQFKEKYVARYLKK